MPVMFAIIDWSEKYDEQTEVPEEFVTDLRTRPKSLRRKTVAAMEPWRGITITGVPALFLGAGNASRRSSSSLTAAVGADLPDIAAFASGDLKPESVTNEGT